MGDRANTAARRSQHERRTRRSPGVRGFSRILFEELVAEYESASWTR
jgi:hypothetical protein